MTDNTITSVAALRNECDGIAAAGHSVDREEFIAGLIAIAVPVSDKDGKACAALAVHAPQARLSLDQAVARLSARHAAAKRMRKLF